MQSFTKDQISEIAADMDSLKSQFIENAQNEVVHARGKNMRYIGKLRNGLLVFICLDGSMRIVVMTRKEFDQNVEL